MSLSRWKMMAGVLGVSIGGLAAAASQCPKLEKSKGRSSDAPVAKADPKVPPAGPPSIPVPTSMAVNPGDPGPMIPAAPNLVPAGPTPPAPGSAHVMPPLTRPPAPMADMPKMPSTMGGLPPVPDFPTGPDPKATKHANGSATGTLPPLPAPTVPVGPGVSDPKPSALATPFPPPDRGPSRSPVVAPTPGDLIPPPAAEHKPTPHAPKGDAIPPFAQPGNANFDKMITPPVVNIGGTQPTPPAPTPPVGGSPALTPPVPIGSAPAVPPTLIEPPAAEVPLSKPTIAPAAAAPAANAETKFRIILRVGEGEPTFEVKNGDNLVLKVACEKVDIESPEKGPGLSKVTARGKVRFAGFGAEGSCDALSFMAGTGEVSMTGDVKVQVKDKLGRVESELTSATLKYKIDASAVGGTLKP